MHTGIKYILITVTPQSLISLLPIPLFPPYKSLSHVRDFLLLLFSFGFIGLVGFEMHQV